MPKPLLKPQQQAQTQSSERLSAAAPARQEQKSQQMDKMKLDRLLRRPRSKKYMEAMQKLDSGGHVHNQQKVQEIMDALREEFPEVEISSILLGCVSRCYLGKPYEVHTLDMAGGIIEHYQQGIILPKGMEKARTLALRGGYEFIEVYTDCCRAVSASGVVSVIAG